MPLKQNDYVRVIDPSDFNEGSTGLIQKYIPEEKKYVVGIPGNPKYREEQLKKIAGGKRRTRAKKTRKSRKSRKSRR